MSISFGTIPSNLRVPFFAVEFDGRAANQGVTALAYRCLIIGQKTAAGTGTANTIAKIASPDDAATLGGRGSMLHLQAKAWFKNNKFTEVWIGILADNGAGVAATGNTLTFVGTATAPGTIALYIGGVLVSVGVATGDLVGTQATNVAAAINLNTDLPVTAVATLGVVALTHRHKGLVGNSLDVRVNYNLGDALPAGVTVSISPLSGGTTSPVLTGLITALGDSWFQVVAHPYTDATSLTALEAEWASRFGPMRMIDGILVTSAAGTFSTLGTLGLTRNSPQSLILAQPGQNPVTSPFEYAAGAAAQIAASASIDPGRPFQTLQVVGALLPAEIDLFTLSQRNLLLFDGIATSKPGPGGAVLLERMITTYTLNAAGSPDTAYLDATTMLVLLYLRFTFRTQMQTRYPRHKLADDGTRFGAGQAVITPKIGKAEAISWFGQMEQLGLVQKADDFKANLVVQRSLTDPNRLEFLLPPTVISQLIVGAAQIQFRL